MKKISFILIVSMILLSLMPAYASTSSVSPILISINDEVVQFTDELGYPFIDGNNRTQVPFRVTLEKFGATVSWNNENYSAIAEKDGIKVEVPINQNYILKNGEKTFNDTKAIIKDGRTYLPIRVVLEAFGCKVGWDNNTKTVLITSTESPIVSQLDLSDIDTDKDGLSDFQEIYKYYTDPNKADSDGDGIPDGDWNERREYTYTIYTKLQIAGPWDINAMNTDYQDTKIIKENKDYVECEILFYPENSMKESITSNDNWGDYGPEFDEYLKPYIYANWDEQMKQDLLNELKDYGIDPEKLSDKELVQQVSFWIKATTKDQEYKSPAQFYLKYDVNGNLYVDEKYRDTFEQRVKIGRNVTDEEIFNTQVLGKQMYYNKTIGGCTSTATYATTIYRALGIPTRMITSTRIIEGVLNFTDNIENPLVKATLIETSKMRGGHQTTEVYIDGRWVRMDIGEYGADNIHRKKGLHYQNLTINDYSDIDMAASYSDIMHTDIFNNNDFYNLLDLSDSYGKYYTPRFRYEIDPALVDKYIIIGNQEFYSNARNIVLYDLQKFKTFERLEGSSSNISNFKKEYFNEKIVLIISADTNYNQLPSEIKNQIKKDDYLALEIDEYKTFEINNSTVLIIKK